MEFQLMNYAEKFLKRKIFDIDMYDEFKRAQIIQVFITILTFSLSFIVRKHDRSVFSFSYFLELIFLISLFKFYFQAQKNRNYSYWGITFIIIFYLLRAILQYTFIEYYPVILYVAFLSLIFVGINTYFMSSPLFYPRVQWWEYDFRFRGDFKVLARSNEKSFDARLTDLRRNAACLECFEHFFPGEKIVIHLDYESTSYDLPVIVKIISQQIPGRPYRYGVLFIFEDSTDKKLFNNLKKLWDEQNKVKLRNKFKENNADYAK